MMFFRVWSTNSVAPAIALCGLLFGVGRVVLPACQRAEGALTRGGQAKRPTLPTPNAQRFARSKNRSVGLPACATGNQTASEVSE
jgi:hypothetical protein